ncbi:TrmH family RNA methyltransferase [Patescibacteria group bacterium]|nr:TrmH family RNA methyltransferase [Patescibacteria group bacterium]
MALRMYKKKLDYSYTFGIFPTIELLKIQPDKVITVLLSPDSQKSEGVNEIKKLCNGHKINFDVSPHAINKLAQKENAHVIGVFNKYFSKLKEKTDHLVLVNPSDMGNVGTIVRTMVGFGVENLALIRPAADIFDPKVVRSSMGAVFHANFEYFSSFGEYEDRFSDNTAYPFILDGKLELGKFAFNRPSSLVFGNEGCGLDKSFLKYENTIKIPNSGKIDPLNLSVAVGIGLYEFLKS